MNPTKKRIRTEDTNPGPGALLSSNLHQYLKISLISYNFKNFK